MKLDGVEKVGIAYGVFFVLTAVFGTWSFFAADTTTPCMDLGTEKSSGGHVIEYAEKVDKVGCHWIAYIETKDGLEQGWLIHRRNCPCGWYEKEKGAKPNA